MTRATSPVGPASSGLLRGRVEGYEADERRPDRVCERSQRRGPGGMVLEISPA